MAGYSTSDTIIAPATAQGRSALAVTRISGRRAFALLLQLVPSMSDVPGHATAKLATIRLLPEEGNAETVNEQAVITCWHAPNTYTGEDLVEISSHGNPLIVDRLVQHALRLGARFAEAGEFTYRAYLNGKLDLMQAEAVHDVISAGSTAALRLAESALQGIPGRLVSQWQAELLELLVAIETINDYASDDLDASVDESQALPGGRIMDVLSRIAAEQQQAVEQSRSTEILRRGINLAIVGPPNVGKSTLFNALLGYDRALVHSSPGTTRDYLAESVEFGGLGFRLIDTAGQRTVADDVESAGVRMAADWEGNADLVLSVSAVDRPSAAAGADTGDSERTVNVVTRCDLLEAWPQPQDGTVFVSGADGRGIEQLREIVVSRARLSQTGKLGAFNARQVALVSVSLSHLQKAVSGLGQGVPADAVAQDIHLARESLQGINTAVSRQDVIDGIFSTFCVGK